MHAEVLCIISTFIHPHSFRIITTVETKKETKHTDMGEGFRATGGACEEMSQMSQRRRVKKVFWGLRGIPRVLFHTVAY